MADKKLVKIASNVFGTDFQEMRDHLDEGDVSDTLSKFFKESGNSVKRSLLTLSEVDDFLDKLSKLTKQVDQEEAFESFCCGKITTIDMKWVARIIKKDLMIGIGPRYVLGALHEDAYDIWKKSSDLDFVVKRACGIQLSQTQNLDVPGTQELLGRFNLSDSDDNSDREGIDLKSRVESKPEFDDGNKPEIDNDEQMPLQVSTDVQQHPKTTVTSSKGSHKRKREDQLSNVPQKKVKLTAYISLNHPVKPMLAKACKTFEEVIKFCPSGFYTDIKYDGERIQIHKDGSDFKYYSRNLKSVMDYKIQDVKQFIMQACTADKVILDGEILMVDPKTSNPLPFGSLGKHKRKEFGDDIVIGIYLFDILYLDGKSLLHVPMKKRRRLLKKIITPIQHRVMIGETLLIDGPLENRETLLADRMSYMISNNFEGLVIKGVDSPYEPNSRHWLKMKKDYLLNMADTADLVVVGAYFGTGSKSGLLSVFLMAAYDPSDGLYYSVCRCGNGHNDNVLQQISDQLMPKMHKIQGDYDFLPQWIVTDRTHVPDMIMKNPKEGIVFEIAGAEFSKSSIHPIGISIRFPRVVRVRDDKDVQDATTVKELKHLYEESKKKTKVNLLEAMNRKPAATSDHGSTFSTPIVQISKKSRESKKKAPPTETENKKIEDKYTSIKFVARNFVDPYGSGNKLLIHIVDNSGHWNSSVATLRQLRREFGDGPKKKYEKSFSSGCSCNLGDTQLIRSKRKCPSSNPTEKVYIANLIVQEKASHGIPPLDITALEQCLEDIGELAQKNNLSVHMQKIYYRILKASQLKWNQIEELIQKHIISKGASMYIYSSEEYDQKTFETRYVKEQLSDEAQTSSKLQSTPASSEIEQDEMNNEEKVLQGVTCVIDGYSPEMSNRLKEIAENLGADVQSSWNVLSSTHLICGNVNALFHHVSALGGVIVSKEWIEDSWKTGYRMGEKAYTFKDVQVASSAQPPVSIDEFPKIFKDCIFFIDSSITTYELKRKIFIYYGDTRDTFCSDVTHVIIEKSPTNLCDGKKVITRQWISDCITQNRLI